MKIKILSSLLAVSALLISCDKKESPTEQEPALLVNTLIGTDGYGNVYPGASAPFGMVQLSPDNGRNGWHHIAGYYYPDTTIAGFSHTHLSGTGAGDLYDLSFMPAVPPFKTDRELGVYSLFNHDEETARAGYYQVRLSDYDIDVELTATERCGVQRYTFPASEEATVLLNLSKAMNWDYTMGSDLRIVDDRTIEGYRLSEGWARDQRIYFVTRFSQPFTDYSIDTMVSRHRDPKYAGIESHVGRFVFNTTAEDARRLVVVTAISPVSVDGARRNLEAEAGGFDFDRIASEQRQAWNRELGTIEVSGGTHDDRVSFYTALYRTMIAPVLFSDVDGQYFGPDGQIHRADGWRNYTNLSLWDTYRAAHPLYTFTQPGRVPEMVQAMLAFYEQHGMLPVWPLWGNETDMMIGYHSVPVVVEAYLKGLVPASEGRRILDACVATANNDDYRAIGLYKQLGYVPADREGESVSKTLEYAYDDYCIAQLARALGDQAVYEEFTRRADFYKNVFNAESGFMQPRLSGGEWLPGFDPFEYTEHITESNGWQYLWAAQHDVPGMIALLGGVDPFERKLDEMFTLYPTDDDELPIFSTGMIGQYAQGNEPSHHVAYLYNYIGKPEKTQRYTSQIMRTQFTNTPDGIPGNEDYGQMSAWYVFSALGFYPVDPVSLTYALGTPIFEEATMHLPGGKTFRIVAKGVTPERYEVAEAKLNGQPLAEPFITWEQIVAGGTLEFIMK